MEGKGKTGKRKEIEGEGKSGKYNRVRKREREEEEMLNISLQDNPNQANGLRLLRKYRSRSAEFEKTDKKKVGRAWSKKLTAATRLLTFNELAVTTTSEMESVVELWKFWRNEGLKETTGDRNKIRVVIMPQEEGEGPKIMDIATYGNIQARMNP
jgi:hypothetical protein